jgi:hypothetical protein
LPQRRSNGCATRLADLSAGALAKVEALPY